MSAPENIDPATVAGFGQEWGHFDQAELGEAEAREMFEAYFSLFDFNKADEGFDLGCGSGRWAKMVAPRVGKLHCIDPSDAIEVARRNLADTPNAICHRASADDIPLDDGSQDFGYSLGVLHHIPDPARALGNAVRKLRRGGQMLVYVYYALDNRNAAYRTVWRATNAGRHVIARLPFPIRKAVTSVIAAGVYWPMAKLSATVEKLGGDPHHIPLSPYRSKSFYTMRTDALDRFGTRLEHRFTREALAQMMRECGLADIRFSEREPYWIAIGRKA